MTARPKYLLVPMGVGFVAASPHRRAVLTEVAAGERDAARIARKHRLVPRIVESALEELAGAGLVARGAEGCVLTPEGERTVRELRSQERPT